MSYMRDCSYLDLLDDSRMEVRVRSDEHVHISRLLRCPYAHYELTRRLDKLRSGNAQINWFALRHLSAANLLDSFLDDRVVGQASQCLPKAGADGSCRVVELRDGRLLSHSVEYASGVVHDRPSVDDESKRSRRSVMRHGRPHDSLVEGYIRASGGHAMHRRRKSTQGLSCFGGRRSDMLTVVGVSS